MKRQTWRAHAPGSKVWLVSAAPKAKLQQVMMSVAQKAGFELVPVDAMASGFADAHEVAGVLAEVIQSIPGLERSRLLLFGGWESASRGAGVTMQLIGGTSWDHRSVPGRGPINGPGGRYARNPGAHRRRPSSGIDMPGASALLGWATGNLPEPTKQSASGNGKYADDHARAAKGESQCLVAEYPLPERDTSKAAATNPNRKRSPCG